ncbi:granzyme B-like [Pholidichthys leucotaenia]
MAGVHNFIYVFLLVSIAGATETGIVNGQTAKPHSRKYMVSLQHGGMHVCGGLLIREDFILTAAHCLKRPDGKTRHTERTEAKTPRLPGWSKAEDKKYKMVCTNFSKKQGGICQGDSGGPLICNTGLVGITAFLYEADCNDDQYPHVFTKVGFFLKWIRETMGEN